MIGTQIKPDYSDKIAEFVKNGGEIKQAVNTNRVELNFCPFCGVKIETDYKEPANESE